MIPFPVIVSRFQGHPQRWVSAGKKECEPSSLGELNELSMNVGLEFRDSPRNFNLATRFVRAYSKFIHGLNQGMAGGGFVDDPRIFTHGEFVDGLCVCNIDLCQRSTKNRWRSCFVSTPFATLCFPAEDLLHPKHNPVVQIDLHDSVGCDIDLRRRAFELLAKVVPESFQKLSSD